MYNFAGACIDNECFECRDDGDCYGGSDDKCVDGECIECVVDADCEPGELCRNGDCCGEAVIIDLNALLMRIVYRKHNRRWRFCRIEGTCLPNGTCDNTTDQCTKIGQYCVEADQKCAWCIEDEDCAGWNCDEYTETTGPICNGEADCRDCKVDAQLRR